MKTSLFLSIFLTMFSASSITAQTFDQVTRPVAWVQDTATIELLMDQMLIASLDEVEMIEIIDVTANGYGLDDIMVLYPSREIFQIHTNLPPLIQELMASWMLESDFSLQSAEQIVTDDFATPRGLLASAVVQAVDKHYSGASFELRLSRGSEGINLEMWNFDEASLFTPPEETPDCGPLQQRWRYAQPVVMQSFRLDDEQTCTLTSFDEDGKILKTPCQ